MGGRKGSGGVGSYRHFMGIGNPSGISGDNKKASKQEILGSLNQERYELLKHALVVGGIKDEGVKRELSSLNKVPLPLLKEVAPSLKGLNIASGYSVGHVFKGYEDFKDSWGIYHTIEHIMWAVPKEKVKITTMHDIGTTVLHEFGHHVYQVKGHTDSTQWRDIHKKYYSKLPPYYKAGGPGGKLGRDEFFAQVFSIYATRGREELRTNYGDDIASYMDDVFGRKPRKGKK